MATNVSREKKGDLMLSGTYSERLPAVTNGLVAHFPFDGQAGTFDIIGGRQLIQHTTGDANLIDAMKLSWKDPANWNGTDANVTWDEERQALKWVGYHNAWIKTPIIVDPTKHYKVSMTVWIETAGGAVLYLGGDSLNILGQRVTGNYTYTLACAESYTPLIGKWTTFATTYYGTGAMNNGTRYNFEQIGWTGDAAAPTDKMTYYYYLGGLFNYNSGGVMYIKDLSVVVSDADNSNCTVTSTGIAVEEATTNLVASAARIYDVVSAGAFTIIQTDTTRFNTLLDVTCPTGGKVLGHEVYVASPSTNKNHYYGFNFYPNVGYAIASKTFTLSVWVRGRKGDGLGLIITSGNEWFTQGGGQSNFTLDGTWQNVSSTGTFTSSATGTSLNVRLSSYGPDGDGTIGTVRDIGTTVWYSSLQVEEKVFATSFVNGSRAVGALKMSNILPKSKGSVAVSVTFHEDNSINGSQGSDQYCFGNQYSWNATNCWWFHDTATWWIYSSNGVQHSAALSSPMVREQKTHLLFVYDDTDGTMDIYKNGVLNSGGAKHADMIGLLGAIGSDWTHSGHAASTDYKMCQTIHSLSFYNRALTASEARILGGNNEHIITNFSGIPITERSNGIPSSAIYFPLGNDGKDLSKIISPTTESNTVYENGGVWVGPAITNLYASRNAGLMMTSAYNGNYGFGSGTNSQQVLANDLALFPGICVTRVSRINSGVNMLLYVALDISGSVSSTRTISFYYKGTHGLQHGIYNNENHVLLSSDKASFNNNTPSMGVYVPENLWTRVVVKGVSDATGTSYISWMPINAAASETLLNTEYWLYTALQVEDSPYPSPFVNGTRGVGKLYLPVVKAQNTDFTINLWFKSPSSANRSVDLFCDDSDRWNGQLRYYDGYSQFELLVRANSRGATSNLYVNIPAGFNLINWNMITLVSEANYGVHLYCNGSLLADWPNVYPQYTALSIGRNGMGDGNVFGGYYRDLIVTSTKMTAAQIQDIYKIMIRQKKDNIIVQGNIIEGASI